VHCALSVSSKGVWTVLRFRTICKPVSCPFGHFASAYSLPISEYSLSSSSMAPKKNGTKTAKANRASVPTQQLTIQPPTINTAPSSRHVLRFKLTNPATIAVTRASLLSLFVSLNENLLTSVVPQITAVRVNRVSVWTGGGNASTVDFVWLSDLGMDKRESRAWMGGLPAELKTFPPRNSRAGMWSRADSTSTTLGEVLFEVNAASPSDAGTSIVFVDVDLGIIRADATSSLANAGIATITTTGGTVTPTVSGMYVAALDNIAPGVLTVGAWSALPVGVSQYSTSKPTTWTRAET